MVKPAVQSESKPARADGAATRELILASARRRLVDVGYAGLNVRDIARDAGVNHALINYHFRSKQQLVLEVLDAANKTLLERQTRMYSEVDSASAQWQRACDFYEDDLESGFVRLLTELMGASLNDPELRREFVPRLLSWKQVVHGAVKAFIARSGLELPVSDSAIAAWITWYWVGIEASMSLGITEEEGHHREGLAAVATLLRRVEDRNAVRKPAPPRRRA